MAPELSYNITAAFIELDYDQNGLLSGDEISLASEKLGAPKPSESTLDQNAFRDYIVAESITVGGSFDVKSYFPESEFDQGTAESSVNEDSGKETIMIVGISMGVIAGILVVVVLFLFMAYRSKDRKLRAELRKKIKAGATKQG